MAKRDPFDFSNTSDLPEDIQHALRSFRAPITIQARCLDLLRKSDNPLNAAELRAAFYRVFDIELTRVQASNVLHHLARDGRAQRTAVGRYTAATVAEAAE